MEFHHPRKTIIISKSDPTRRQKCTNDITVESINVGIFSHGSGNNNQLSKTVPNEAASHRTYNTAENHNFLYTGNKCFQNFLLARMMFPYHLFGSIWKLIRIKNIPVFMLF